MYDVGVPATAVPEPAELDPAVPELEEPEPEEPEELELVVPDPEEPEPEEADPVVAAPAEPVLLALSPSSSDTESASTLTRPIRVRPCPFSRSSILSISKIHIHSAGTTFLFAVAIDTDFELLACPLSRSIDIIPGPFYSLHLPSMQTLALP